ncbi:hypothetical protein RGQ29_010489 [Quercus rubra]|uniref:Uncharacterized protein n=1 Tax=Quercus rubra TaxID=3512 RepID=A0AAN7G3M8_QUERU|nr:hypothetical protein RGQ29_010489 [Quercus rubra]
MGKRHLRLALWLLLMLTIMVSQTHEARHSQFFKMNPKSQNSPHNVFGYLPRGNPIPPSGPSKQHNDIGLQSSQQSP